jgi:hypothetical protein
MKQQFKQVSLYHKQLIREKYYFGRYVKDRAAEILCPEKK